MNLVPRISIVTSGEVIHYAGPVDSSNIVTRLTMCGINQNVSGAPTKKEVTCRTCNMLVDHIIDHQMGNH